MKKDGANNLMAKRETYISRSNGTRASYYRRSHDEDCNYQQNYSEESIPMLD